jgi:hypothetical protein
MTTHTVNAHGVDPATVTQAHAERVAAALGLEGVLFDHAGLTFPVRPGWLSITVDPVHHHDIVTLPWSLVAGLGEAACQPIRTAPRDGTMIVLHFGQDVTTVGWWSPMAYGLVMSHPWRFLDQQTDSPGGELDRFVNRAVNGPGGPSRWSPLPAYQRPNAAAAIRNSRTPNEAGHG